MTDDHPDEHSASVNQPIPELVEHVAAMVRYMVVEKCAKIAEQHQDKSDAASNEYDGGSGSLGYEMACREIATAIRNQGTVPRG